MTGPTGSAGWTHPREAMTAECVGTILTSQYEAALAMLMARCGGPRPRDRAALRRAASGWQSDEA